MADEAEVCEKSRIETQMSRRAPREVVARLRQRKIVATTTPYAQSLARLSPSIRNSSEEIETSLSAIRALG